MIAVVGGGITGLATARALLGRGADVVVLEASTRAGGVIRSAEVDGRVLDFGPQRTRLTRSLADLVRELALDDEVLTAPSGLELFIYRDGALRAVPFTPGTFLRTDLVSVRGRLRMLLEPLTAGADPGESVARYFERKLGVEVYRAIVAPLYGGLYASDPADMVVGLSLQHVLRELGIRRSLLLPLLRRGGRIRPPPACSFRAGMAALPEAIARALGGRLRTGAAVRTLERAGGAWRLLVEEERGGGGWLEAEHVVLAVPAPAAAALLEAPAPDAARRIGGLRYNPLGVVHLDAETPRAGLGFQVAFTEAHAMLRGVTFNESLFGRDRLQTAYLGGALRPDVAVLPEDRLASLAVEEFRRVTNRDARALSVTRARMPAWDRTWRGLAEVRVPDGIVLAGNWWSRPGIPGRLAEAERIAARLTGPA